ncbi:MAG: metallopeptidase TldD-related protein [Promethearchaeota archaeon]
MSQEKLDLLEQQIKSKNIAEYEIFLIDRKNFESIFLKEKVDNEREISEFEYVLRILTQKENQTGIGIIKGNSLEENEIACNIDTCQSIAKNNLSSKFHFPSQASYSDVSISDKKVVQDPLTIKYDLTEELISEIKQYQEVQPTFGRLRVHIDEISIRNSNALNLSTLKSYFFIEFSLKAQKKGKISEYWPFLFIKELDQINFPQRVAKWVRLAQDSLIAQPPKQNGSATVMFSPFVLHNAINPVVGPHASGRGHHLKISRFKVDEKAASENITIIDDGMMKGGLKSNSWDGEGSPHQRIEVIKNGIFQNRIYDQKFALIENQKSTGNGIRSLMGAINNDISNFEILPGTMNFEDIISEINEGYYIDQFSWLNPSLLSGAFGAEIRIGYYIKNGKIEHPIKLGNVSGNVLKMINNCEYISKEREYFENSFFPYMVFNNLTVTS